MSSGPRVRSISATAAATAAGSETSAAAGNPPVAATTASIRASRIGPLTPTDAPSAARRLAMAAPMPCVAPLTRAMRPECRGMSDHRTAVRREHLTGAEPGVVADQIPHYLGNLLWPGKPPG